MALRLTFTFLVLFLMFSAFSQNKGQILYEAVEYDVINTLYGTKTDIFIYEKFQSSFEIIHFLVQFPDFFNELFGHCIQENKTLSFEEVFDERDRELLLEISKKAFFDPKSNSEKIDGSLLQSNIKLYSSDYEMENKQLLFLTKPIILKNKAFLLVYNTNEANILILNKSEHQWEILCRKSLYLTFVNPVIGREE